MEKISKDDVKYLLQNDILKLNKQGNYGDNLIICGNKGSQYTVGSKYSQNSQHSSRHKQRFTTDYIYNKLMESQKKDRDNIDLSKVKHNQLYLFSDAVS